MAARPKKEEGTTTVGTRFEIKQKELIEKAANLSGCSPAKFIRDAAVLRAISVMNSSGEMEFRLRKLATMLIEHIENPTTKFVTDLSGDYPGFEGSGVSSPLYSPSFQCEPNGPGISKGKDFKAIKEIRSALETCRDEFVRILIEEWAGQGKTSAAYKPKINPADLMGDL